MDTSGATVLVVDDHEPTRDFLRERLEHSGFAVFEAGSAAQAMDFAKRQFDLVLLDCRLPDGDGVEIMPELQKQHPGTEFIVMTAHSNVPSAVTAMKLGAFHYAEKPLDLRQLMETIERALERTRTARELRAVRTDYSAFDSMIGESKAMRDVKLLLAKVATCDPATVLLTGESGTGKDTAAKAIHASSPRALHPFVNITCSALPDNLLESELFGHERGAFTDAKTAKEGLFERAHNGTVFLDEIGEMVPALQAKLLRFLEEKQFRRVGGTSDIHVDVRVVAATNRVLEDAVRSGRFREDLYYRLSVLPVPLPPLRDRGSDVRLLAQFYVDQFSRQFSKGVVGISSPALEQLESYPWPGNVRELRNTIERAVLLTDQEMLGKEDFHNLEPKPENTGPFRLPANGVRLDDLERDLVAQALERTNGNRTSAARLLGLNRDQIRYRIGKYGLPNQLDDAKHSSDS